MIDLYPRLFATVTAMQGRVGPYPSLKYTVGQVVYHSSQDIDALTPLAPINVIHEDKNRHISQALSDLSAYLTHNGSPNGDEILVRLKTIGRWISDHVLANNCLCCCQSRLPRTVEILTDQHEIPWEITWVNDGFLAQHAIHARYPFVSRTRICAATYPKIPKLALLVGRSEGLFSAANEISAIRKIYKHHFNQEATILTGEQVTTDVIRAILAADSKDSFNMVHFIGHGNAQADQAWLELVGPPFLDHDIPALVGGNPLIFWNACLSGSSTSAGYRYQADVVDSFGGRLLSSGASHFIGPLFPVFDDTATQLAVSFYRHLFSGDPIGVSFFKAKKEASATDPLANTYVLYGNPAVRMVVK